MSKKISLVKNFFFAEQRVTQQEFTINFICYLKHPVPWLYLSCKYAKNRVKPYPWGHGLLQFTSRG